MALTGAGVGTSYTLTNVAYRSFSSSMDQVHQATIAALKRMEINIIVDIKSEEGRTITAATKELEIVIKLEEVTSNTTQLKVDARKNVVLKDKATAAEIINQVGKLLGEENLLTLRDTIYANTGLKFSALFIPAESGHRSRMNISIAFYSDDPFLER